MKVSVVGTGYVGLTTGVCLAARGHDVTALDLRDEVVARINRGEPPIHEKDLPELLARTVKDGKLKARRAAPEHLENQEIILVAVGTPTVEGRIDLSQIEGACRMVGAFLRGADAAPSVVVKSTVVPGTTDTFVKGALEKASGKPAASVDPSGFGLGMNPEFLREGEAVYDFMNPDRLVLGHDDAKTLARLEALYAPFPCERVRVNSRTAELIKYANNALLALQISATNELANLAASLGGVDIMKVMEGVHLDRRWNPVQGGKRVEPLILTYLIPGCGFGGSCFPKDVQALCALARDHGSGSAILDAVLEVNQRQPHEVCGLVEQALGDLRGKKVLVLGLAFKPGTDDVRESTSLVIVKDLAARGAVVRAHDPIAASAAKAELGDVAVDVVEGWRAAVPEADAVIVATRWPEYLALSEPPLASALAGKLLVDPRRMFSPEAFPGARYAAVGLRARASEPTGHRH